MTPLRLLVPIAFLLALALPVTAETVGHFDVVDCNEDGCEILTPDTGEVMEFRLTRKELAVANKAYDTLVAADKRLEARGFADVARVAFAYSVHGSLTPDGWIGYVVVDVFLRRVHGNTWDEVHEGMWSGKTSHAWEPIADTGPQQFHPTTGVKLSVSSVKTRAQSLPDCFRNGDPARDCRPIRYDKWSGCLLSDDQQQAYATEVAMWRTYDQADLGIVPDADPTSQIDLSSAEVTQRAQKPVETPKKTADNPAGRPACNF
jgi:hypothetical protein